MTSQPRDLERTVQRSGIERLRVIGVVLYRRNVMTIEAEHKGKTRTIRAARRGQADTYGWIISTGVHVEIEWKRYGERPTKEQIDWLQECTQAWSRCILGRQCIDSRDRDESDPPRWTDHLVRGWAF